MAIPDDAALGRLAAAIRLQRDRFNEIYDAMAAEHGGLKAKPLQAMAPMDEPRYLAALRQARDDGWFSDLSEKLVAADAFPEIDEKTVAGNAVRIQLQGVVQKGLGFLSAGQMNSGTFAAIRRVCKVRIDSPMAMANGTGFLVGPQAVITAWHVIAPLLDSDGDPRSGTAQYIRAEFDDLGSFQSGTIAQVAEHWLVGSSRFHPSENPTASSLDFITANPTGFDAHLDYAVIRLEKPIGRQRGFYRLDRNRKPCIANGRTDIVLFQHPAGASMKVTNGVGTQLWPPDIETRFRHNANSLSGSSGGLVLDADFEPVALHQCGISDGNGGSIINGAIPTSCIARTDVAFDAVLGLDPVHRTADTQDPVVGRENFQRLILQAISGEKRILAIRGDRASGKSFTTQILKTALGVSEHTVVEVKAADISALPEKLVATLLEHILPPGSSAYQCPHPSNADTAQDAWIRDVLVPDFIEKVRVAVGRRTLWLVVDDLDVNPLANTASRHVLERLYHDIAMYPFLRFVLIGLSGSVPAAIAEQVGYDQTGPLELHEITAYVERHLAERPMPPSQDEAATFAKGIEVAAGLMQGSQVRNVATLIRAMLPKVQT